MVYFSLNGKTYANMDKRDIVVIVLIVLAVLLVTYLATVGLLYLALLAIGKPWCGWKIAFGIWLCLCVLSGTFSITATRR